MAKKARAPRSPTSRKDVLCQWIVDKRGKKKCHRLAVPPTPFCADHLKELELALSRNKNLLQRLGRHFEPFVTNFVKVLFGAAGTGAATFIVTHWDKICQWMYIAEEGGIKLEAEGKRVWLRIPTEVGHPFR